MSMTAIYHHHQGEDEEKRDIALVEKQLSSEDTSDPIELSSHLASHQRINPAATHSERLIQIYNQDSQEFTNQEGHSTPSALNSKSNDIRERSSTIQAEINGIAHSNHFSCNPFVDQHGEPSIRQTQSRPEEIPNFLAEALFILVCSTGQLLFGVLVGNVAGLQLVLTELLRIEPSQIPWLTGSFLLANGLSVIVSGPLADLIPAKFLICGAFAWQTIFNIVGVFSLNNKYLFFIVRGCQGLSVGVLVSSSISVLGRVYQPGIRKTRVFSIMAAMAPFGFWLGTLQGGALYHSPKWIFATSSIISGFCLMAGIYAIPNVKSAIHTLGFKSFDFAGSASASTGCALLVAGLTQGPAANWQPYAIVIVILGLVFLSIFFIVERKVHRPLLPPALWRVPGFTPMIISYFVGYGAFMSWQFFVLQFWLQLQHASPLTVALYLTPNAIFGVLATFIVSRIAHIIEGHWIFAASMVAFAVGPVFFLPQTPDTIYWALSMPGIAITTFGPDLSFAAASIFVTSSVAKSYQGSAGSLVVTVQNLSAAIMISLSESIGDKTEHGNPLKRLHSIWWFDFAASIAAAILTLAAVRIPKTVEKEHEQ